MSVRKSASLAIAGVASAAMVISAAGAAHADDAEQWFKLANTGKSSTYSIPAGTIVGTGSDTTQFVVGQLAADYNKTLTAGAPEVFSIAACASPAAGASILTSCSTTPNFAETFPTSGTVAFAGGSGPGANLLNNAGVTKADIAFSRASGLQQTSALRNYPFAVDQLVPVVSKSVASNAPATISLQELAGIYQGVYTNWKQLGGKDTPIHAYYINNTGSGTFQYFGQQLEGELGKSTADKGVAGYAPSGVVSKTTAFVSNVDLTGKAVIEHDPSAIVNDPNAITAMSYSRVKLGADVKVLSGFIANRPVYNVLRDASLTPSTALVGVPADWIANSGSGSSNLVNTLFGPSGYFCSTNATSAITAQGFFQLDAATCGIPVTSNPSNLKAKNMATITKATEVLTGGKAGATAKVSATVVAQNAESGAAALTGTVTFKLIAEAIPNTKQVAGGTVTATIVDGVATATVPASVPAGTYQVSAAYSGDANYQGTWTDGNVTTGSVPVPATITVTAADKVVVSKPALGTKGNPTPVTGVKLSTIKKTSKSFTTTFTATVKNAVDASVKIYDGKKVIGSYKVVNGKATIKLKKKLKKGTHKIKVVLAASTTSKSFTKTITVKVT